MKDFTNKMKAHLEEYYDELSLDNGEYPAISRLPLRSVFLNTIAELETTLEAFYEKISLSETKNNLRVLLDEDSKLDIMKHNFIYDAVLRAISRNNPVKLEKKISTPQHRIQMPVLELNTRSYY